MARVHIKRRHSDVPQFESVARISSLPIVESGIYIAGNVYDKIKVKRMNFTPLVLILLRMLYVVCSEIPIIF